ncbi:RDD family protein [Aliidiomarina soli]|uniref:RDD domain-containing protein n=1 Tax=Aliidiomarina soli TaxID=1928574 RepID=A0A432WDA3_9GAMM|nr:RDD family protein [Aliidiomarina soli]RUO30387.1 hypothetical protein CWE14_13560 [Aliidiomarina soli]
MSANPDHTVFPRAGFFRRVGAWVYDLLAITAILMLASGLALAFVAILVASNLVTLPADTDHASVLEGNLLFQAYLIAVVFWFFAGFWVRGGQTIGMRAWRMKVQNTDGSGISWKQATIRLLLAAFGLSNIGVLFSREKLGWHDRVAGCEVIELSAEANKLRNWRRLK